MFFKKAPYRPSRNWKVDKSINYRTLFLDPFFIDFWGVFWTLFWHFFSLFLQKTRIFFFGPGEEKNYHFGTLQRGIFHFSHKSTFFGTFWDLTKTDFFRLFSKKWKKIPVFLGVRNRIQNLSIFLSIFIDFLGYL